MYRPNIGLALATNRPAFPLLNAPIRLVSKRGSENETLPSEPRYPMGRAACCNAATTSTKSYRAIVKN
jgi:hypothetical protein